MSLPIPIIDSLIDKGGELVGKFIKDKDAVERFKHEYRMTLEQGDINLANNQIEVNKVEAAHPNIIVAGWRPGLAWVCIFALANNWIIRPYAISFGYDIPEVDAKDAVNIIMLLAGLRQADKHWGNDTKVFRMPQITETVVDGTTGKTKKRIKWPWSKKK